MAKELGSKVRRWHSEKLLSEPSSSYKWKHVILCRTYYSRLKHSLLCKGTQSFTSTCRHTRLLQFCICPLKSLSLSAASCQLAGCSLSKKDFRPISSAQLPSSLLGALYKLQQSFCLSDPHLPDMPIVHASEGFLKLTGRPRYSLILSTEHYSSQYNKNGLAI